MELEHLSDAQIYAYVTRNMSPAELLRLDAHLANCEECQSRLWTEVDGDDAVSILAADMRHEALKASGRRRSRTSVLLPVAAALLLIAVVIPFVWRNGSGHGKPTVGAVSARPQSLSADYQQLLQNAIREQRIERPAVLESLVRPQQAARRAVIARSLFGSFTGRDRHRVGQSPL